MVPDRDQISVMDSLHARGATADGDGSRRRVVMHGPPCYRHVQARSSSPYVPEKVVLAGLEPGVVDTMATDAWSWTPMHVLRTLDSHMHSRIRSGERQGRGICSVQRGRPARNGKRSGRRGGQIELEDGRTFRSQKLPFRSLVRLDDFDRSMPMPVRGGTMTLRRTTDDHLRARRHDVPSDVDVDGARRGVILRPRLTCMQPE